MVHYPPGTQLLHNRLFIAKYLKRQFDENKDALNNCFISSPDTGTKYLDYANMHTLQRRQFA